MRGAAEGVGASGESMDRFEGRGRCLALLELLEYDNILGLIDGERKVGAVVGLPSTNVCM